MLIVAGGIMEPQEDGYGGRSWAGRGRHWELAFVVTIGRLSTIVAGLRSTQAMNRTWYTSFFTGVVVEMWRDAISPEHTRLEADYLAKELRLSPGARVLDVPCGHGRHSVELARRGYRMTGVDISPEMIRAAQAHAASAGVQVEWRNAEMRELAGPAQFDAAFCFGNSFGYLDRGGYGCVPGRYRAGAQAEGPIRVRLRAGRRMHPAPVHRTGMDTRG